MKITAVIMAGGKGERFWPKSRTNLPKQFLSLTDDGQTMIQHTAKRLLPIVDFEDMFVVTNKNYLQLVQNQLPEIPKQNIIVEPIGKNTAPCIGLAATVIDKKYDDAIMIVLPSDHLIKFNKIYIKTLKKAIKVAENGDNLVTIGIRPSYPETGYGYIHFENYKNYGDYYEVKKFVEKPDIQKAKEYLDSDEYLWNSGMFVWKTSSIMKNLEKYIPQTYNGLMKIKDAIGSSNFDDVLSKCFDEFVSESIDYAIMEKADDIFTVPGDFGWDDVGSWLALERINKINSDGNVILYDEKKNLGNVITIDTENCIISGSKKLIAVAGIKDIIIVDTDDATLICHKKSAQQVKDIISKLKKTNKNDLL